MDTTVVQLCTPPTDRLSTSMSALASIACQLSSSTTSANATTTEEQPPHLDPEKRQYIFQLIQAILQARLIAGYYNVIVLIVILGLAAAHWRRTRKDRARWHARVSGTAVARRQTTTAAVDASTTGSCPSSSSSSTLEGNSTPPNLPKTIGVETDIERLPLLPKKHLQTRQPASRIRKSFTVLHRRLSAFLTHQPPPIPIINKSPPPNSTTLFVTSFLLLNIFFIFLGLPLAKPYFFVFATKSGLMFIVNLPLLYLLSAKNQPLCKLTGYSYESLNIFHRRLGEWMCFLAAVHFSSMVGWQFYVAEEWLRRLTSPGGAKEYFSHPVILQGLGALVAYEMLFFTSLGRFRQRWYEIFLASHVALQIAGLGFLWFHFRTSRLYVTISLGIFLVDRLAWRMGMKKTSMVFDLAVTDDGRTVMLSGNWDIPPQIAQSQIGEEERVSWWKRQVPACLRQKSIIHGWEPADHVFLSVPALGRSHALQAHPFTIASAAPPPLSGSDETRHAWLSLLIRAQDGFTEELVRHARTCSRVEVRLDGPYGSPQTLNMLRASDCVILVAGGSGIAVAFPLAWELLMNEGLMDNLLEEEEDEEDKLTTPSTAIARVVENGKRKRQSVHLIWLTHSRSHRSWIPQDRLDEMAQMGLDLVMPEPTEEAGRPDVAGLVEGWIRDSSTWSSTVEDGERPAVGVVCSGPDGLNRLVRNVCADVVGGSLGYEVDVDVRVAVEKFGW